MNIQETISKLEAELKAKTQLIESTEIDVKILKSKIKKLQKALEQANEALK